MDLTMDLSPFVDVSGLSALLQPEAFLYLGVALGALILAVASYGYRLRIRLGVALATDDNKALSLSMAAFFTGAALIAYSLMTAGGHPQLGYDLLEFVASLVAGLLLLHAGRWTTDRFLLPERDVAAALRDGNVGVAVVEAGNVVATALIVSAALSLDGVHWGLRLSEAIVFFGVAQTALIAFASAYCRLLRFDVRGELDSGNPAVGIALGGTLVAQAILLAYAIGQTPSLVVFGAWFVLSSALLLGLRRGLDGFVLRGHDLDVELSRDRNWGVALVEGVLAMATAWLMTGAF